MNRGEEWKVTVGYDVNLWGHDGESSWFQVTHRTYPDDDRLRSVTSNGFARLGMALVRAVELCVARQSARQGAGQPVRDMAQAFADAAIRDLGGRWDVPLTSGDIALIVQARAMSRPREYHHYATTPEAFLEQRMKQQREGGK